MTEAVMERTREAMPTGRTYFAEFSRKYSEQLGEAASHFVEGYATTDADIYGIRLTLDATRGAMVEYDQWRNVRFMHEYNPVGVVRDWRVDDRGLWVRIQIMDEAAWQKIDDGLVTGFSIGFGFELTDEIINQWLDGETITPQEYWLTEISIVDRPADTECSFSIVRRAEGANTGDGTLKENVRAAVADILPEQILALFSRSKKPEGGEGMAEKEMELTAEIERLKGDYAEKERALADAKAELEKRDAEAEEQRKAEATEFATKLAEEELITPAEAEPWVARYLADAEWATEHAEALRVQKDAKPTGERNEEGRPADKVPGEEDLSNAVAERARELQKEDEDLTWEAAVATAAKELEGA